jgi:glycosyltransferase involved in cell wall biosynthesis
MLKLSFILPCYNVTPYIGRCIESIEHQDIPQSEYEVICVDDCSTDDTVQKIKEYQAKYPNIQLICHEVNKTAGGARNTGIDAAKGEYLWFVDPDDAIVENVLGDLSKQIEKLKVDILFFNYNYIDEDYGYGSEFLPFEGLAPKTSYSVVDYVVDIYGNVYCQRVDVTTAADPDAKEEDTKAEAKSAKFFRTDVAVANDMVLRSDILE